MLLNEKKNHYLRTGLILTGLMTALALVGCVWTPYSPTAMSGSEKFLAPCLRHLFGTDNFGRDIFSRVLAGAGTTFFISAATVCIGAVAGTLVGAFTGYFGGWLDEALMRVNDAVTAFPSILLALVFISLLGVRQVQRDPGPGRRLCAQLCPGHPQRICPAPGDELCQKRPAHGSGASAHYVSAYSAQHPAGAPADAGDRV